MNDVKEEYSSGDVMRAEILLGVAFLCRTSGMTESGEGAENSGAHAAREAGSLAKKRASLRVSGKSGRIKECLLLVNKITFFVFPLLPRWIR